MRATTTSSPGQMALPDVLRSHKAARMSLSVHSLWTSLESASSLAAVSASGLIRVHVSPDDDGSVGSAKGPRYKKEKRRHHAVGVLCSRAFVMAYARSEAIR